MIASGGSGGAPATAAPVAMLLIQTSLFTDGEILRKLATDSIYGSPTNFTRCTFRASCTIFQRRNLNARKRVEISLKADRGGGSVL